VTKTIEEVRKGQLSLRSAYQRMFNSPDAEPVMADLYKHFNGTTLKHKDGVIDPNASIAAAGCREVLLYIELMMRETHATSE
jgi:hypothetical protein